MTLTVESAAARARAARAGGPARARARAEARRPCVRCGLPPRRLALVALPAALGLAVAAARRDTASSDSGDHAVAPCARAATASGSGTVTDSVSRPAALRSSGAACRRQGYKLRRRDAERRRPSRLAHTDASLADPRRRHRRALGRDVARDADRDVARRLREVGRLPHAEERQRRGVHRAARPGAEREDGASAGSPVSARSSRSSSP